MKNNKLTFRQISTLNSYFSQYLFLFQVHRKSCQCLPIDIPNFFSHSAVLQFMQDENGTSIFHHFYPSLLINFIGVETKKLIFKYFQTGCPKKQNAAGATVHRLNHQLQLLIFVTGATTGGGVLFSSRCRFFLPILANSSFFVANSRIFCCNFIGTNISYDH